jgi:IS5 family transposase
MPRRYRAILIGHTLATVIPDMEALVGTTIKRIFADKDYRGHNAPPDYKFRDFIAGQKRRMMPEIKREMRRRSAVEPVIGHIKSEHRMGRWWLKLLFRFLIAVFNSIQVAVPSYR